MFWMLNEDCSGAQKKPLLNSGLSATIAKPGGRFIE
jgi:hypothetical protein